ncbi:MAG: hypothetical protein ACLP1E_01905 [Acidimicrobiales bacterium]
MIIKIDQSFVSPSKASIHNDTLLEPIVSLGHKLNMTVHAEGIPGVVHPLSLSTPVIGPSKARRWSASGHGTQARREARPTRKICVILSGTGQTKRGESECLLMCPCSTGPIKGSRTSVRARSVPKTSQSS